MTNATTPLLLLIDGLLSQDEQQILTATGQMASMLLRLREIHLPLPAESPTPQDICRILHVVLGAFPDLASTPSKYDGSLPLHFAASLGEVDMAALILNKFPSAASTPNSKGKTPLHYAAREGRLDMVNLFIRICPQCASLMSSKRKLALHFAAAEGHIEVVKSLLQVHPQGASIPSTKGKLAIHMAARWGKLEIAHQLLFVYPDGVRALDWEGSLPLHDAAREGQYQMSRYLVERFPAALARANLRGEIPLFPAVRSENVDLVVLLLQAFPMGGKHILKTCTLDDNVSSWRWDIVELLLRGAVGQLDGHPLLEGKEPPTVRLVQDIVTAPGGKRGKPEDGRPRLVEPAAVALPTESAHAPHQSFMEAGVVPRSKSPILEVEPRKKRTTLSARSGDRKRPRAAPNPRRFLPLHAALECKVPCHVLSSVLENRRSDLAMVDDFGRHALHWAVAACEHDNDKVELIIREFLNHQAARARDEYHQLPLHLALANQADTRVILALLEEYPESGVETCQTRDEWHDSMAIHMACQYNCELSTVYELVRVDPSVVKRKEK
jgi:ankyrin repeat protein